MKKSLLKQIIIKNTLLDRRFKITEENAKLIKTFYDEGFTQKEIAELFNVSQTTISRYLLPEHERLLLKEKIRLSRRKVYYSKSVEERYEENKRWRQSTEAYKEALLETKIDNLNI